MEQNTSDLKIANQSLQLQVEKLTNERNAFQNRLKDNLDLLIDLEQSQARLKMVIESIQLGTWDFNPSAGNLTWSDECKKIYGIPTGEAITFEVFADHIYPADKDYTLAAVKEAMDPAGKGMYDVVFRITRFDDKSVRWVRSQGKVYFNSKNEVERFIGTVLDITDITLAEQKTAYMAAIVESSDDAIISKTLDGIITSWNGSAERLFGYTPEEIIGKSVLVLIPDERKEEEPEILARLRRGERVDHFETQRITKDKKLLDLSLTISPIKNSKGTIIGVSKIARDITDKKREQTKKNDFIAIVSHELKTPLTSIKSYIQVLLAKAVKNEDVFQTQILTRAEAQIKKMVAMISDFLSLSRLEEAKINLTMEKFDLSDLISEVVTDAEILSGFDDIVVTNCVCNLYADRDKIGQILTNLVSNAIKYSPDKKTIYIGCEQAEGKVKISIRDQGIGISAKDQLRLFERFYRVENDKIKNISGFGVGLYLVSELLRCHGSQIKVESKEGVGSNFYFFLDIVK